MALLLRKLRAGYAEHGEAWLRTELDKQNLQDLRGLAVAASVQQKSAGRTLSKADLLEALSQSIVGEQASWGIGVFDDCPCQLLLQRGVSVVANGVLRRRTAPLPGRRLLQESCLPASTLSCERAGVDDFFHPMALLLRKLRAGYAEQGEAWLRTELDKQNLQDLRGLAVAASVQQKSAGGTLSKADLLEALSQSIVGEQASWGIGVFDDCPCQLLLQRGADEPASQQKLQELRTGYAEQGAAWLRTELDKQNRQELAELCIAADVRQKSAGRKLSRAELLEALSQSIVGEQASWGSGVLEADEPASQQRLQELRTGYAEQGAAWLRGELRKHSKDELAELCVAADVQRHAAGRTLSKADLLEALSQSIVGADEPASQQKLQELCAGYAEQGAAWLRTELDEQNREELAELCIAADVRQESAGRKLSRAELLEALSQSIVGEQASWGSGVLEADEPASQQRLQELRTGYAEQGAAWLRGELRKHSKDELAELCVAADVQRHAAGRTLSKADLLEALSQSI
ncbi:unnamed protein product, partial [Symbiodinium sp. CCMP2592]